MLKSEYKVYFLLVRKYHLEYESTRVALAQQCCYWDKLGIDLQKLYSFGYSKILGKDAKIIADIAKDLEKLNEFCTSYYPLDCQLKITNQQQTKEKFCKILTYSSFKVGAREVLQKFGISFDEVIKELEEYREYFATDEQKKAYDRLRQQEDCTYRLIEPLLGKRIVTDILSSTYQEAKETWARKLGKSSRMIERYANAYLDTFASSREQQEYQEKIRQEVEKPKEKSMTSTEKRMLQYMDWLSDPVHHSFNYKERFLIVHGLTKPQFNTVLSGLKSINSKSSLALFKRCEDLIRAINQKNEERLISVMNELTEKLIYGVYDEKQGKYREMNVLDYIEEISLPAAKLISFLDHQNYPKKISMLWRQFIANQIGHGLAHYQHSQYVLSSLDYPITNEDAAINFTANDMESFFGRPLTIEEKLETYHELKKNFLTIPGRLFYATLKAKYGPFMEKALPKLKQKN